MQLNMTIAIPHEEDTNVDRRVYIPSKAEEWIKKMRHSLADVADIRMFVDNVARGCGGVAIGFLPSVSLTLDPHDEFSWLDEGKAFGFIVSRRKLAEIIQTLQYALDNFEPFPSDKDAP